MQGGLAKHKQVSEHTFWDTPPPPQQQNKQIPPQANKQVIFFYCVPLYYFHCTNNYVKAQYLMCIFSRLFLFCLYEKNLTLHEF